LSKAPGARVLIAGGGVAALEAVLALQELTRGALEIALLAPGRHFEYTPLSVAEPFGLGRAHRFELAEILGERGVETIADSLATVDVGRREARTAAGLGLPYAALLVATGARRRGALPGAITFAGARAAPDVRRLLHEARSGALRRLVFAVPPGVTWSLPAYELALMSAAELAAGGGGTTISILTPEPRPVDVFGARASAAVAEMLELRGIAFRSARALRVDPGELVLEGGATIAADAVVALPRLLAPEIEGLPAGADGFLAVDEHGRVRGLEGVYAAGDATDFPLKQGGIASQQADAAAAAIAAELGFEVGPAPFRPALRGLLLTGRAPRYLRAELLRGKTSRSSAAEDATWWPPAKIASRRLAPFLALHGAPGGPPPGAVALELEASGEGLD
jgi:sulfide:quinone oxidoreductase